jgi:polar amino acid transport system permease protein
VTFVDVFRAIPVIVILFLLFFALPYAGVSMNGPACAIAALSLNLAAVAEEAFWAGIRAVPDGQLQAARSLGLPEVIVLALIILPQSIRLAIPLVTSKVISTTKDTALASVVAVPELLNQMSTEQGNYANPSPLMLGSLIYLAMFIPLVVCSRSIEQRHLQLPGYRRD